MNEENNKKRNKIIIIVAVLFLLTAGIITVYSFKDTKAEEIESFTVNSDLVFLPPFYEFMESYSGIKLKTSINSDRNNTFYYKNSKNSPPYYDKLDSIELQDVVCTYNESISASLVDTISSITLEDGARTEVRSWYLYDKDNENKICENNYCCKITIKDYPILEGNSATPDNIYFYISGKPSYDYDDSNTALFVFVKDTTGRLVIETAGDYPLFGAASKRVLKQTTDGSIFFNRTMVSVTLDGNGGLFASSKDKETMTFIQKTSVSGASKFMVFETYVPERDNYKFVGWEPTIERNDVTFDSENPRKVKFSFQTACDDKGYCHRYRLSLKAIWEKEDSSDPNHPSYSVYYKDSIGHNTVDTKTHPSSNFAIINGKNDYCVGTDANKIFSYWKNMTVTSDTNKYCLDTASGCTESITIPSGKTSVILKAVCSSNSGGGSTSKYTLTLKKNCSGTFKCVSDTNSEVCNQLKNNGKFTKSVTKGDTFTFPKTFDTLTCDGNEINSWGNFELGQELEIKSNIIASAKWKSSSGGGDTPSTDEYTVTLKKNCSGTFKCVSDTNSEVCNQLKNNGKFTKSVTKGDTFIFPKTFDALTCDGENIDKWGIYNLGSSITVNSNITASAKWKNSSSIDDPIDDPSDDPIDDPIDNPQTGSIVIYLVLLFGIGALAYSVWYFRGFRKN